MLCCYDDLADIPPSETRFSLCFSLLFWDWIQTALNSQIFLRPANSNKSNFLEKLFTQGSLALWVFNPSQSIACLHSAYKILKRSPSHLHLHCKHCYAKYAHTKHDEKSVCVCVCEYWSLCSIFFRGGVMPREMIFSKWHSPTFRWIFCIRKIQPVVQIYSHHKSTNHANKYSCLSSCGQVTGFFFLNSFSGGISKF